VQNGELLGIWATCGFLRENPILIRCFHHIPTHDPGLVLHMQGRKAGMVCTVNFRTFGINHDVMKTNQSARLEIRLSKELKEHLEYMAQLGGFKTLTDFMLFSAQKEAKRIQKEKGTILSTVKDWEIFIDTMLNPPKPNAALRRAFKRYKNAIAAK
jgi:uncharacterized protein (DUF1778 family)